MIVYFWQVYIAALCGCHESMAASCGLSMNSLPAQCGSPTGFNVYVMVMFPNFLLHPISNLNTNLYILVTDGTDVKFISHAVSHTMKCWWQIIKIRWKLVCNIILVLISIKSNVSKIPLGVILNVFMGFHDCPFLTSVYSCLMWMPWVNSSLMRTIHEHFTSPMWIFHSFR